MITSALLLQSPDAADDLRYDDRNSSGKPQGVLAVPLAPCCGSRGFPWLVEPPWD